MGVNVRKSVFSLRGVSPLVLLFSVLAPSGLYAEKLGNVKDLTLLDPEEERHHTGDWKKHKAVVLFFLGTDCPVSNFYVPTMNELAKTYQARGVACFGVYADPDLSAENAKKHAQEYRIHLKILLDAQQKLARQAGVKMLSQVVVISPQGPILYRGRIDDRYSAEGRRRDDPRSKDLENALQAVLAGKMVQVPETPCYGCPITFVDN
jgi:peroxiredoxin